MGTLIFAHSTTSQMAPTDSQIVPTLAASQEMWLSKLHMLCHTAAHWNTPHNSMLTNVLQVHFRTGRTECSLLQRLSLTLILKLKGDISALIVSCVSHVVLLHNQFIFYRIHFGAMRGPRDASVRQEKRLQLWHWRHVIVFLQYGIPPWGGARANMSGRWSQNVERSAAEMCW